MTEEEICGGGHRTWLKDQLDQLVCLWGAPSLVYKGVEEGASWPQGVRPSPVYKGGREEAAGLGGAPRVWSPTRTSPSRNLFSFSE